MADASVQYPYSIKFSIGTIVLMLLVMLILLSNTIRANDNLGWVLFGVFAFIFLFLLILLITTRLIPALRGDIALALDEQGINDYIRDVSINWEDVEQIKLIRGRSASTLQVDLKFESDYGSQIGIPLRWVKGKDEEIYDAVMTYFEDDGLTEYDG